MTVRFLQTAPQLTAPFHLGDGEREILKIGGGRPLFLSNRTRGEVP